MAVPRTQDGRSPLRAESIRLRVIPPPRRSFLLYANMKAGVREVLSGNISGIRRAGRAALRASLLAALASDAGAQADPRDLAQAARQAMAEQRFGKAAEIYTELAGRFPNEPALLANLGMARHFSGQHAEAIEPLQQAAQSMPASFPAHFALGASLSRLGRNAEAIAPLRKATQINPRDSYAHILLGETLEAIGEYAESAAAWRALGRLDATNPQSYAGLVRCNEELAASAVDQLRQLDPESPYLLRILGRTRLAARQYPSALYLFRSALEKQPGVRAVHEAVAAVYEGAGQPEWAQIERAKAASVPEPDCAAEVSAECDFAAGRFERAASSHKDSSPASLFWAARSYAGLAAQAFERLTSLPESIEKLTLVADVLAAQGQFSRAADTCRRAVQIGTGSERLERQLAELLYLAKRTEEAMPLLRRFHAADPNDPRWGAMLGNLLAEEQEYEEAIPLLRSSLALPGAPASVQPDLGRSYLALGQAEKALPHLQASLDLDSDGSIHYQLAQALQRLERREQAREALTQYQALNARFQQEIEAGSALEITPPK